LGGTGKTPLCIYLARLIHDAGCRVAIISRGYRGGAEKTGAVIESGPATFSKARWVGDEPALMARLLAPRPIPILVGRDRIASGRRALARFQPEVVLLDDGFQHHRLARDLDIVLLDGENPLGNGHLLPRGPLREPPSALARADILVLTRCPPEAAGKQAAAARRRRVWTKNGLAAKPLFASQHRPVARERLVPCPTGGPRSRPLDLAMLKDLPVLAFAGIARSETFRRTVIDLGADLRGWLSFRDHHPYRADDLDGMAREGRKRGAVALVTTDKDRLRIHDPWIRKLPLLVIGVRIDFGDASDAFQRRVFQKLALGDHRGMHR
jgi:tetraacyldisaccharide 4'-kinase